MSRAILKAVQTIRRSVDVNALTDALTSGSMNEALALLQINKAHLYPIEAAVQNSFVAGGELIAVGVPVRAGVLGFDGRSIRAERWVKGESSRLIQDITNKHIEMTRTILQKQLQAGRAPRSAALDMAGRINRATGQREGGYIGLNRKQAEYIDNAIDDLRELNPRYLNRKLRDPRFDDLFKAARVSGKPLTETQVQTIAQRYRDATVKYRAETIARTESITALRAGRREGMEQAVEQNIIRDDRITRVWDATGDSRTRPDHMAMDGRKIEGLTDPWVMPNDDLMMFPGDTSLGALGENTISCRCYERFDVNYLKAG